MTSPVITDINHIIKNRKSIYPHQYEPGKKVDEEIILRVLENANFAPNHKKTEPWRFTVFADEGRKTFADMQVKLYKKHNENPSEVKIKKFTDYPMMASHIIAIGMKRSDKLPEVEEILAVGCAIENMFLTTTAYGLGAYLSTGGITYMDEAKTFFRLGPQDKLIGFFYIGHKKDISQTLNVRGDIASKTTWIRE